jgi:SAM-dependent methyltransferase
LIEVCQQLPQILLELGSGGGSNASHLKAHFRMTLVDLSAGMLAVSKKLNPELEHIEGDMRTVRLCRLFDAVFIHDAIMYLTTESDLRKAIETAFVHCRPGGAALFAPDWARETFRAYTHYDGHDGDKCGICYLYWIWDPDPSDSTYVCDFAYMLREGTEIRVEHDQHVFGLFAREQWLDLIREVGFEPRCVPFIHREIKGEGDVFLGRRR